MLFSKTRTDFILTIFAVASIYATLSVGYPSSSCITKADNVDLANRGVVSTIEEKTGPSVESRTVNSNIASENKQSINIEKRKAANFTTSCDLIIPKSLIRAAKRGDIDAISNFITENHFMSLRNVDEDGRTLLNVATKHNKRAVVEFLLEHHFPIDYPDKYGRTALMVSIQYNRSNIFQYLINKDASVNATNVEGWTPALLATLQEHVAMLRVLHQHGANLNQVNENGLSPVLVATLTRCTDSLNFLINQGGADPNIPDESGTYAIIYAVSTLDIEILTILLASPILNLEVRDKENDTPLSLSVLIGNINIIRSLVQAKANVNVRIGNKLTPLLLAAKRNATNTANFLLSQTNIDVDVQTEADKKTALMYAAQNRNLFLIQSLNMKRANPFMRDINGLTAYDLAVGHDQCRELLKSIMDDAEIGNN